MDKYIISITSVKMTAARQCLVWLPGFIPCKLYAKVVPWNKCVSMQKAEKSLVYTFISFS